MKGRAVGNIGVLRSETDLERRLLRIWEDILGHERVDVDSDFFDLGGHSLAALQVVSRIRSELGIEVRLSAIFDHSSVRSLASFLAAERHAQGATAQLEATSAGTPFKVYPLTPSQTWMLEQPWERHDLQAFSLVLQAAVPLDTALVEAASRALLRHHDALRARFIRYRGRWAQVLVPVDDTPLAVVDLHPRPDGGLEAALEAATTELNTSLRIADGPVVRFGLARTRPDAPWGTHLLVSLHHLTIDSLSSELLIDDFETAYLQLRAGLPVRLPRGESFASCVLALDRYAQGPELLAELEHWLTVPWHRAGPLPTDRDDGPSTVDSIRSVEIALDAKETRRLRGAVQQRGTGMDHAVLAAAAGAIASWTGNEHVLVDVATHGRNPRVDADLSRTVGWFAAVFPTLLSLDSPDPLVAVRTQLERVPNRGMGFGPLYYLNADPRVRKEFDEAVPKPQIYFNYLGESRTAPDRLLRPLPHVHGQPADPSEIEQYAFEIDAIVRDGRLIVEWSYSERRYDRKTIEQLVDDLVGTLQRLSR